MLITGNAFIAGLLVPLAIGAPGTKFATNLTAMGGVVAITAVGASWTAGAPRLTFSKMHIQGSNQLTPGGAGTLALVSPGRVFTTLSASPVLSEPSFLNLTFVPEPGTLLLVGAGVVGLAAVGVRRHRV
ncbi:MAG TPA: PEP-CTERM sorting domain-containing protein [Myxococcota bacterium]|nr:PEP-CTERM sorting domain-containing protein [Myxococcota bacterium]